LDLIRLGVTLMTSGMASSTKVELEMTVVGIILARGGSKRLPGKNIRPLLGKPLIAYSIDAARGAKSLSRTIVSTDDREIARIAAEHGAEVPFLRPAEFATDASLVTGALSHAVDWLEQQGTAVDTVVLLQATSPLRRSEHIDGAVALFEASGADTVTAVTRASAHPYWCWKTTGDLLEPFFSSAHMDIPRDQLPGAAIENGAIYVFRRELLGQGRLYGDRIAGYFMDSADAIDVDHLADFQAAECILLRRMAAGSNQ
jgi:CMP-N,N'-diacetyllegionaminic acid synthase